MLHKQWQDLKRSCNYIKLLPKRKLINYEPIIIFNAIRSLGLQAINLANQGPGGMTVSAAPILYALYKGVNDD